MKNNANFAMELIVNLVYEINNGSKHPEFQDALNAWKWSSSELEYLMGGSKDELDESGLKTYNEISDWYEKYNF